MWVGFPGTELSEGTLLEIYDKNEKCIIVLRTYTFSNFIAYEQDTLTGLTLSISSETDWIFANTLQTNGTAD